MNLKSIQVLEKAGEAGQLSDTAVINLKQWLTTDDMPEWAIDSLNELIKSQQWEELNDRFYKDITFGTGGMRGRTIGKLVTSAEKGTAGKKETNEWPMAGSNALNDFTLVRATTALFKHVTNYLAEQERFETPSLVIAHDVRHFSRRFCMLAASVWNELGGMSLVFDGPRSTPQLSFAVRFRKTHAGIVITASHNPPHDNGFKAYFEDGAQVVSPHAEGIVEQYVGMELKEIIPLLGVRQDEVQVLPKEDDLQYLNVVSQAALDPNLIEAVKPKVVFTPIHGTGAISTIPVLWELGMEPIVVDQQSKPDPNFPTVKSPNPENAEALEMGIKLARKTGASAVIATDPDSDRMGVAVFDAQKKVKYLNGNEIGAMLTEYRLTRLKELGCLPDNGTKQAVIIKTFVTTPLVETIANSHNVKCVNTLTGFKWTGEKIRKYQEVLEENLIKDYGIKINFDETDYYSRLDLGLNYSKAFIFACEESYGYLPYDFVRDKDANASTIAFCEMLADLENKNTTPIEYLNTIYENYGYYNQFTLNLYFNGASGADKIKRIVESYLNNPPKELGEYKISNHINYGEAGHRDEDKSPIPTESFHVLSLEKGYSYAVRASGTEPKIKFYVFGNAKVDNNLSLKEAKESVNANINTIVELIEKDAQGRAQ